MNDMLSLLPEDARERFDSRYRMVIAASQRAKHLMQGPKPASTSKFTKETTIALDEVLQGNIDYLTDKEARHAMREAKHGKDPESERMAVLHPAAGEDAREIKKELSIYVDDSQKPAAETEVDE
jgi:DNA-directed RNA polymerase subunit omega